MSADQVQQLTHAVQALTLQVQTLQVDNVTLRQALQVKDSSPVSSNLRFEGNPLAFQDFMDAAKMQFTFKPLQFATDRAKVGFIVTQLQGPALSWATELVNANSPILNIYDDFEEAFAAVFQRINKVAAAEEALCDLQQGNMETLTYVTKFRILASEAKWPEAVQLTLFRRGLKEELKDELARVPRHTDFNTLTETLLQMDYRLQERRKERRRERPTPRVYTGPRLPLPNRPAGPAPPEANAEEPMQLGSLKGPLTEQERRRRRENMLCMYCGEGTHLLRNCPVAPPRRFPGNEPAQR